MLPAIGDIKQLTRLEYRTFLAVVLTKAAIERLVGLPGICLFSGTSTSVSKHSRPQAVGSCIIIFKGKSGKQADNNASLSSTFRCQSVFI